MQRPLSKGSCLSLQLHVEASGTLKGNQYVVSSRPLSQSTASQHPLSYPCYLLSRVHIVHTDSPSKLTYSPTKFDTSLPESSVLQACLIRRNVFHCDTSVYTDWFQRDLFSLPNFIYVFICGGRHGCGDQTKICRSQFISLVTDTSVC